MSNYPKDSFGWELLYNLLRNDIKEKKDVLLPLVHYVLLRYDFRRVTGENEPDASSSTELLSPVWNNGDEYVLKYAKGSKTYTLRSYKTGDDVHVFTLVENTAKEVQSIVVKASDVHWSEDETAENIMRKNEDTVRAIMTQLVAPLAEKPESNGNYSTHVERREDQHFTRYRAENDVRGNRRSVPVGYRDLHPVLFPDRDIGGGMIFDPMSHRARPDINSGLPEGRLPRDAVPPGARFDVFGPPDLGRGGFPPGSGGHII